MRISKIYRPELIASRERSRPELRDLYLDVEARRLVAMNGRSLVALPVRAGKRERSRRIPVEVLRAARKARASEEQAEVAAPKTRSRRARRPATAASPAFPPWRSLVPRFRRGDRGTFTVVVNAGELKAVADALGLVRVTLTVPMDFQAAARGPVVVQPVDPRAEEVGVLLPAQEAGRRKAVTVTRSRRWTAPVSRRDLETQADAILLRAGDRDLTAKELR